MSVLFLLTLFQVSLNSAKPHTSKRNEYSASMGIQVYFPANKNKKVLKAMLKRKPCHFPTCICTDPYTKQVDLLLDQ